MAKFPNLISCQIYMVIRYVGTYCPPLELFEGFIWLADVEYNHTWLSKGVERKGMRSKCAFRGKLSKSW